MTYEWGFGTVVQHWPMFLEGLAGTLQISAVAIAVGLIAGAVICAGRMSRHPAISLLARAYVDFFRNTPGIVHFFWMYYALPVVTPIRLGPFEAAVAALSTQSAAFYCEVFRGGITSIRRGQWEGGRALGMTNRQVLWRVVVPQAITRMIPPLTERTFELIKTTSLASTLAYGELLYQAMKVASITYRPLEVYTVLAAIYFVLLTSLSHLARLAERRHQAA